jgi:uncharacterized membrane protein
MESIANNAAFGQNADGAAPLLFDAELRPYCSMPRQGFYVLIGILAALALGSGAFFLSIGAWPIFGFYGLDILLVYLAMRRSYARAERHWESVRLTESALTVERHGPRQGQFGRWLFQPYWLRVEMDDPAQHESQVVLASHGRRLTVGSFLAPEQRLDFARALRRALERLRQPAHPES